MNSIQFPREFVKLLFALKPVFTRPSFTYFNVLIAGILLGRPKKTVTAATRIAKLEKKFSNVNRFVSQYCWDVWKLGMAVFHLITKALQLTNTTLTVAIDSTILHKFGSKIFGCAYHYNYDQKRNSSRYIWGHQWLVMGLLYCSKLFDKWLCFPFLAQLFVPKNSLPSDREYQSSIDLAVEMITYLKSNIKQNLILVADGYFAKRKLLGACQSNAIPLISRLQSNAALYGAPEPVRRPQRGRPAKYGRRLPSLAEMATQRRDFIDLSLKLYGKKRHLKVKRIKAIWKPAAQMIHILIVLYEKQKKPAYFFCTDGSLSTEDILTRVAARWSLENTFKDLKEHLGWSHWQCRVENAVSRSATLTCVAASLLMLWSLKEATQRHPEFWDTVPWYTHKATPSIRDMIEQLRNRILDVSFFAIHRNCQTMAEKERAFRQLVRLAA